MTQLLEKAIQRISSLPEDRQLEFASFILAELDSDERWETLFESSQNLLSDLAAEAVEEERAGKTDELDLNRDFPQD